MIEVRLSVTFTGDLQAKVKVVISSANFRRMSSSRDESITRLLGVIWSSEEAHTVDALAVRGDERRGSLR